MIKLFGKAFDKSESSIKIVLFGKDFFIKGRRFGKIPGQMDMFAAPEPDLFAPTPGQTKQFAENDLRKFDPVTKRWIDADKEEPAKITKPVALSIENIVDILKADSHYSETHKDPYSSIANKTIIVLNDLIIHGKDNPIQTNFNEKVYFEPDKRMLGREKDRESAYIKYAAHFVTGQNSDGKRVFDRAKADNIQYIKETLESADERIPEGHKVHYIKKIEKANKVVLCDVEVSEEGYARAVTFMPNKKDSQIFKLKEANKDTSLASNTQLPAANSPTAETPHISSDEKIADGIYDKDNRSSHKLQVDAPKNNNISGNDSKIKEPQTAYSEIRHLRAKEKINRIRSGQMELFSDSYVDSTGQVIKYDSAIKQKKLSGPSFLTEEMRELNSAEGEFCAVERQYQEYRHFNFTSGSVRINNGADVAYLFRQLETEAIEHAFMVHINDKGEHFIQHISTGGIDSSVIDPRTLIDSMQKFKPVKTYFVHNHPSGRVEASPEDKNMMNKLSSMQPETEMLGIILDTRDNKFAFFGPVENGEYNYMDRIHNPKNIPQKVYSFSKLHFHDNVTMSEKIASPDMIAKFISQSRFSIGEKHQALILDPGNKIVGRYTLTKDIRNTKESAREIMGLASKGAGIGVIVIGNKSVVAPFDQDQMRHVRSLKLELASYNVSFLDYMGVEPSSGNYASAIEHRYL